MIIRTIIIDDEEPARDIIRNWLKDQDEVEIIAECTDGFGGVKAINEMKPDIVFLDIQMPKLTGFEMLELIDETPLIIFITAYDQYAIKAFEMNATDYLLKPFTKARFEQSLQKAMQNVRGDRQAVNPVKKLLSAMEDKPDLLRRIAVKSGQKIHVIAADDIFYIGAEGDYVMIYTKDNRFLKEKTMKYMESHLDPSQFVRIHRSTILNVNFISRVEIYDKESYAVLMKNNVSLKASINGYKVLKQLLKL